MDTRDPLEVRWEEIEDPKAGVTLDTEIQPWADRTDRRRAIHYYLEYRRAANSELLRDVDRDVFLEELQERAAPSKELLQAVVRAFLSAAFRLRPVQTHEGWRKIMAIFSAMLGTAISLGYTEARPVVAGTGPVPRVPSTPPLPPWAITGYESRRPTLEEIEANVVYWKGLPIRLVESLIRAYLNARYRAREGATPEGRSQIMADVREAIWDGVLDAVKRHPCPQAARPTPPPAPNSGHLRRRAP
jgi:hypothetical protein